EIYFRFANTLLLKWYCWLLNDFENNTTRTNHTILRLLYRIAYQLKTPHALYQACLFRIFQKLAKSPTRSKNPALKEMIDFARHLLRSFYESAEKNPLIFMEILFWKHSRLTYELEFGYGTYTNKAKSPWNDELDEKLKDLYHEYQALEHKPENVNVLEYVQSKFPCHKSTQDEFKGFGENLTSDEEAADVADEENSSSGDENEGDYEDSLAKKIPRETLVENCNADLLGDEYEPRDNFLNNKSTTRIESSSEDELETDGLTTKSVKESDIENYFDEDNSERNEGGFFAPKKRKLQILSDDEGQ
uniref:Uncharacterized protein n=1 Tax=Romanomermis culicivorax TaxID=13658 RepID=A0A915JGB2_ROMCU